MDVNVHLIELDVSPGVHEQCWKIISDDERHRANRFATDQLRDRWLVSRAALRQIVASYCTSSPQALRFEKEALGKPYLAEPCVSESLHFNLSHSGNRAVVAVSHIAPLGVDLEHLRPIRDWRQVAKRFFSAVENHQLDNLGPAERPRAFYTCWTRKEAVIKATGEGLSAELDAFDVSLTPNAPAAVLCDRRTSEQTTSWRLHPLDIADDFVGALALRSPREISVTPHGHWQIN